MYIFTIERFLKNTPGYFSYDEISERVYLPIDVVIREVSKLRKRGFVVTRRGDRYDRRQTIHCWNKNIK